MGESSDSHYEHDLLKEELQKLNCELEKITQEKILSAEYGLVLLEEKENLQRRCEASETLNDTLRTELELLREALAMYQTNQKVSASCGFEEERSLLLETASKEASFTSTVLEFEKELKQVRHELSCISGEKERLLEENIDLAKNCEVSEREKRTLKTDLKQLKLREARLLSDNNELEEENISLQKQISFLHSSQVEFEGAKHEVCCLQEEIEAVKGQVEELISLKYIAETQLEEALESLQSEREQKYALRKKLDEQMISESIFNINNLGFSGFGNLNQSDAKQLDGEDGTIDTTLASLSLSAVYENENVAKPQSYVGDLYSELHLSEIKRLEKQLEVVENDKSEVAHCVQETQQQLEKTKSELNDQNTKVQRIIEHIYSWIDLLGKLSEIGGGSSVENPEKEPTEMSGLQHLKAAMVHVEELKADTEKLNEMLHYTEEQHAELCNKEKINEKLKIWISDLKIQVEKDGIQIKELEDDLFIMGEIAKEARFELNFTQDDLVAVSEELAELYHHVCLVNGEIPNRVVLDHVKVSHISETGSKSEASDARDQAYSSLFSINSSKLDTLKEKLKSDVAIKILLEEDKSKNRSDLITPSNCLLDTIRDQLRHLSKVIENTIDQKNLHTGNEDHSSFVEVEDQVTKFKSLISTKDEQIATLRTILKANKHTAEVAMANLKSKYENEKIIVSETLIMMRDELKLLRKEKSSFASMRTVLASRCVEQLEEKDIHIQALHSILKLSIQKN